MSYMDDYTHPLSLIPMTFKTSSAAALAGFMMSANLRHSNMSSMVPSLASSMAAYKYKNKHLISTVYICYMPVKG